MLGRRWLRREVARVKRNRRAVNLEAAHEIGILFSMQSEADFDRISRFSLELQRVGKKVQIIGLYRYRKLPPYFAQKLSTDLILPGHLDMFYRPKTEFVAKFINHPFDMLIDMSSVADFPLHYIAALSKAGFKLGRSTGQENLPYDLMIETGETFDNDEFIRQIVHYTSVFELK